MKIYQVNASYKPAYIYGGPTVSVSMLCESLIPILEKENSKLEVITTAANGETELNVALEKAIIIDGVSVKYFKRNTKDHTQFSLKLLQYLHSQLRKNKTSKIVHIHAWWNFTSILSVAVAKFNGIPVLLSPRGMLTTYTLQNRNSFFKKIIHHLIGKKLINYAYVHVTSLQEKADIEMQKLHPKSISVIPNIVNFPKSIEQRITPSLNLSLPFKLLFLSRIEEKKGLELLFKSLSQIQIKWQLTLAGTGKEVYIHSLKNLIKELKIADKIFWIGEVNNTQKFEVFLQHDLTCLTSYNENFANIVIESCSVGTPVLISNKVGLSDYIFEKDLGWVTKLNEKDICQNILNAFNNLNKRNQIRINGPSVITLDFNADKLANQYFNLYEKIKLHG